MNSLGARISALLTIAILFLVAVATFLALQMLGPPPGGGPMRGREAAQLTLVALAAERLPEADWRALLPGLDATVSDKAPDGPKADASRGFEALMRREGVRGETRLVERPDGPPLAAYRLPDGRWLALEAGGPPRSDRRGWTVFTFWMALIALGTAVVVVLAVMRATRPLAMIERAVAGVGPDGEFAPLPETGPADLKATARAINLLSARLRAAMESRMRLVAAAGHDLRTPMTRMRLRAEFIADEEERVRWLADLEELDRIADSAIRLVREEVDPDARKTVAIDAMVAEIAAELREIGLKARVARSAPASAAVRPLAMKRALRNLVVNAATHGLSATVSIESQRDRVVVAIEDEGPGIPPELIEQAFEPFFRVDPARKIHTPGAGLGLAIAKEIVARNGGELTVANRPSGGLVQVVSLPLAAPEA